MVNGMYKRNESSLWKNPDYSKFLDQLHQGRFNIKPGRLEANLSPLPKSRNSARPVESLVRSKQYASSSLWKNPDYSKFLDQLHQRGH